ncbi:MAG: hypothetical protein QM204_04405 [Bacillota bacterium]|jgi:hypothetical protein|nr:hypothetical protein [Bacillota bacterium]NLL26864.1 hypothetical protein [Erysipelotrichia bacterium]
MYYCFKKINIASPFPTTQCGHISQTRELSDYKDNLFARVISFKDDKNWLFHISADVLAINREFRLQLQKTIREKLNNNNINLITSATHTHYGNDINNIDYLKYLMEILIKGITAMQYQQIGEVKCTYSNMHTTAVGKSRISGYETNLEYLNLITFYKNENIPFLRIVVNNCHPTILHADVPFFSAEYPGYVLKLMEKENKNIDHSFMMGASGDISSRFVRSGQKYENMVELAERLFEEIKVLINRDGNKYPLKLDYHEVEVALEHEFIPIDLSAIRTDLTTRELETIRYGQIVRAQLKQSNDIIKKANLASWNLGAVKIVFVPNEIFSAYMSPLDLSKTILVSYSNGYGPYILPIGFPYLTYEMFTDTLTVQTKEKLMKIISTI